MRKLLAVGALGVVTTALLSALALLAAGTAPDTARANHTVTVGLDLDPAGTPPNAPNSLGSIEDCLEVTAGPFNDDGDGLTDEDPLDGLDNDGDGLFDEDPPGQLFDFDVFIKDVGTHDVEPGLLVFSIPIAFNGAVINIAAVDVQQFLTAQGNQVLNGSDPVLPDSDGLYEVAAADISDAGPLNTGSGVLARVTGVAVAAGVSAVDIIELDLNGDTVLDRAPFLRGSDDLPIGDTDGDAYYNGPVSGGTVAVDDAIACNPDWDGDGVLNEVDNCPNDFNPAPQSDIDGDGFGDECDGDIDGDGFRNDRETLYASNPMVFASTIEVCDGVDNDGDTTVDEDGLDHDNDGDFDDPNIDCNPSPPGTDSDGDGDEDDKENWMATDPYDDCPDNSNDPALAPDIDNNRSINVGDVIQFRGVILTSFGDPGYDRRLDFNADTNVNIGDVLAGFLGRILTSC